MVTYARLMLYPGEVLRIDGDEALEFVCEHGEFWVTADDDGIDHYLRDGDRAACARGRIVVEGDGMLLLRPARAGARRSMPWRRRGSLRRLALKTPQAQHLKGDDNNA